MTNDLFVTTDYRPFLMKDLERRVWLVTLAALLIFVVYETIKTLLLPQLSIIVSHVITVFVVALLTFYVSRYALGRHSQALAEIQRQTAITEETNRLMGDVLATLREAVVIVDSQMRVVLYNQAAARMFNLSADDAFRPGAHRTLETPTDSVVDVGKSDQLTSRAVVASESGSARAYRLTDATREPAINGAFSKALAERVSVELRVELADRERRSFQLHVAPLGSDLAVGVFFDLTQLEKLERVRREFFANLSDELRRPLTAMLASLGPLVGGGGGERVSLRR